MGKEGVYELPKLPYEYNALEPHISETQLKIHHLKHHQAYVNSANSLFEKLQIARANDSDIGIKSILKELSFNVSGHILHSIFWNSLIQADRSTKAPKGILADAIEKEFGSFERFKKEFSQAALTVEGSGWAVLATTKQADKLIIMQIEKHNVNLIPMLDILLVLDVWEHAYYLDYKNERSKFIDSFWEIVNWDEVSRKFKAIKKPFVF